MMSVKFISCPKLKPGLPIVIQIKGLRPRHSDGGGGNRDAMKTTAGIEK